MLFRDRPDSRGTLARGWCWCWATSRPPGRCAVRRWRCPMTSPPGRPSTCTSRPTTNRLSVVQRTRCWARSSIDYPLDKLRHLHPRRRQARRVPRVLPWRRSGSAHITRDDNEPRQGRQPQRTLCRSPTASSLAHVRQRPRADPRSLPAADHRLVWLRDPRLARWCRLRITSTRPTRSSGTCALRHHRAERRASCSMD